MGNTVYEYTCCMSGDNDGEQCGDCCTSDTAVATAMILIGAGVGGVCFLLCCGVCIGYLIYKNGRSKAPETSLAVPQQALAVAMPEPAIEMAMVTAVPGKDQKVKASLQL